MIKRLKEKLNSFKQIEKKGELFTEYVHNIQVVLNFFLLAMMPIIVFALAKTLKIITPDSKMTTAFIGLMTLSTHLSVYAILAMNKGYDKKLVKRLIIIEVLTFSFFPKILLMFGVTQLTNYLTSILVVIIIPGNMLILSSVVLMKLLSLKRD